MKCHQHHDKDAVGTCMDCQVWLCGDCVKSFSIPICPKCNLVRFKKEKWEMMSTFAINTVIGVIIALYLYGNSTVHTYFPGSEEARNAVFMALISAYFGFFIAYGWTFLNGMKDPNTVTVRVNEWILGLIIRKMFKAAFACLIGGFVGPYQIWKMKKRLAEINETVKAINTASV